VRQVAVGSPPTCARTWLTTCRSNWGRTPFWPGTPANRPNIVRNLGT